MTVPHTWLKRKILEATHVVLKAIISFNQRWHRLIAIISSLVGNWLLKDLSALQPPVKSGQNMTPNGWILVRWSETKRTQYHWCCYCHSNPTGLNAHCLLGCWWFWKIRIVCQEEVLVKRPCVSSVLHKKNITPWGRKKSILLPGKDIACLTPKDIQKIKKNAAMDSESGVEFNKIE